MAHRVARVGIDPAKCDHLLAEYAKYIEAVQQDPGVLAWEPCTEADADDVIWILAEVASVAHEHHMSLPETQAVSEVVLDALV
jgi:quinol monooxygenase YgiN